MELLKAWANETLPSSCRQIDHFEGDLCNGYLLGVLLDEHGLLPQGTQLQDSEAPSVKVANLTAIQQPLLDLGVKFNSKLANDLMTETKGVYTYELSRPRFTRARGCTVSGTGGASYTRRPPPICSTSTRASGATMCAAAGCER